MKIMITQSLISSSKLYGRRRWSGIWAEYVVMEHEGVEGRKGYIILALPHVPGFFFLYHVHIYRCTWIKLKIQHCIFFNPDANKPAKSPFSWNCQRQTVGQTTPLIGSASTMWMVLTYPPTKALTIIAQWRQTVHLHTQRLKTVSPQKQLFVNYVFFYCIRYMGNWHPLSLPKTLRHS